MLVNHVSRLRLFWIFPRQRLKLLRLWRGGGGEGRGAEAGVQQPQSYEGGEGDDGG